ncbi:MAG: nucleoside-diphosphate kinase [bacterium]
MAKELAFALINPHTISKSRTGGVIGRITSRTGLDMVAARMFAPSAELAKKFADLVRTVDDVDTEERKVLADYVEANYTPDPKTGRPRRALMLLFEGDDAINKVKAAVGPLRPEDGSGETVRDTYGDYIVDDKGSVRYVEPAVMIGRTKDTVAKVLKLWAAYSETCGGIVAAAADVESGQQVQKTLVIIKPDNFRFPSQRPGNIIDIFSASGLRIVGVKVHCMSVADAEEFYGPVRNILRSKLKGHVAERAAKAAATEFGFDVPDDAKAQLGEVLGPIYGDQQFFQIVQFMTGYWPPSLSDEDKKQPGKERCLILIYAGLKAVDKIRKILGPTDPSKAEPGSVRKEFGQNIMVNAAHASDSPESVEREMKIVKVEQDMVRPLVEKYYG